MNRQHSKAQDQLNRIISLQGGDPGFLVLAVHSFVEGFLRRKYGCFGEHIKFLDLIFQYREELSAARKPKNLYFTFNEFAQKQKLTNGVRHEFVKLDKEEAVAAVHRLTVFCDLAGIHEEKIICKLKKSLELWDERTSRWDDLQELKRKGFELVQMKQQNKSLSLELEDLRMFEASQKKLAAQIEVLEADLETAETSKADSKERIDALRKEKWELEQELRRKEKEGERLREAETYLSNFMRISLYSKSRLDYERSVTRLTKEQQRILDWITFKGDFLIKGAAGTGKTLVLIKALEAAEKSRNASLGMEDDLPFALLTYTNTLVKYDQYLNSILGGNLEHTITTVDSFLIDKLKKRLPSAAVDFRIIEELCKDCNSTDFFNQKELAAEIEGFIFANNVSKDEYCVEICPRKGLKTPLDKAQRLSVWESAQRCISRMEEQQRYSKNYSRIKLLSLLRTEGFPKEHEHIFIDEVQDLDPVDLKTLKAVTRNGVILAGDADQSIYGPGFSFRKQDVDIVGKTEYLKTNFRNTCQIHELAETYRKMDPTGIYNTDSEPDAFRNGTPPELFRCGDPDEARKILLSRIRFFIKDLSFDPENICILTVDGKNTKSISAFLDSEGIASKNLKDPEFDFEDTGIVRVSTMHSSKGLDFPVVILYLPHLYTSAVNYKPEVKEKIDRNLLYVSITRAMDHVDIIMMDKHSREDHEKCIAPLKDLALAYEGCGFYK